MDKALARRIARQRHPGMIMVLTETSLALPKNRSTDDFVILNTDDA